MEDISPEDFPHRLEVIEPVEECSCGGSHEIGDTLVGSMVAIRPRLEEVTADLHPEAEVVEVEDDQNA